MNNSVDECHACILAEWDQNWTRNSQCEGEKHYISGNAFYETSIYDAL